MEGIRSPWGQKPSDLNTTYFVCCQDVVETSSSQCKGSVSWSAGPGASVLREVCVKKKKKKKPKLFQNTNPLETNQKQGQKCHNNGAFQQK